MHKNNKMILMLFISIFIVNLFIILIYANNFGFQFSSNHARWSEFGGFYGGIITPLISTITLIFIVYYNTMSYQKMVSNEALPIYYKIINKQEEDFNAIYTKRKLDIEENELDIIKLFKNNKKFETSIIDCSATKLTITKDNKRIIDKKICCLKDLAEILAHNNIFFDDIKDKLFQMSWFKDIVKDVNRIAEENEIIKKSINNLEIDDELKLLLMNSLSKTTSNIYEYFKFIE
ncbi:hypothetical protein R9X47_00050 [Wukongibacter baidiensis]|uniref:hypothetical protein n=1 Tax=Wukongibacter baidiensis TaxID=1723361 RepID=UPI003D7FCE31